MVQRIIHVRGFPQLSTNQIYDTILPSIQPTIEMAYPNYDWKLIWKNMPSKCILIKEREIFYKFMHEILPTKKRLKEMKKIQCAECDACGQEESQLHIVFDCPEINEIVQWFTNVVRKYCNVNTVNFMDLLFTGLSSIECGSRNIFLSLISTYIFCMWNMRQTHTNVHVTIRYIKSQIHQKNKHLKLALGKKKQ